MTLDIMSWHTFQGYRLLNDNGIREAVEQGRIRTKQELEDTQFQPNTLDVRVGEVKVYTQQGLAHRFLADGPMRCTDSDLVEPDIIVPDEKDIPIILPPGCTAEIYIHDEVEASFDDYFIYPDLRSGRGRNGLALYNHLINRDREGRPFLSVMNHNPNPVKLYGRDRFAQLFFYLQRDDLPYDGHVVANAEEALHEARRISEDVEMHGVYVQFKMGSRMKRYKRSIPEIDTRRKYNDDEIFETIDGAVFQIFPAEVVLLDLQPEISIPNDLGLHLLPSVPYASPVANVSTRPELTMPLAMDSHVCNAGWIDSGYPGNGSSGITAHPRRFVSPTVILKDQIVAYGIIMKYHNPVQRSYGSSDLNSTFSNA